MHCKTCGHAQEEHMGGQINCIHIIEQFIEKNPKYFGYVPMDQLPVASKLCDCEEFVYPDD